MARKNDFGKTEWGRKWVDALENIDRNENRLPRGRTYARNGSVLEIELDSGFVFKAKVQGTMPRPYKITISLHRFNEDEITIIKDVLSERPDLTALMLSGLLPVELDDILKEREIFLFPRSWKEIKADCSCPDWANPCKHIAAVYYIIANEIDKEPFFIFELHGLKKEKILSFCQASPAKKTKESLFTDEPEAQGGMLPEPELSFNDKDRIVYLLRSLKDNPLFYPYENFKVNLTDMYNKTCDKVIGGFSENFEPEDIYLSNSAGSILFLRLEDKNCVFLLSGDDIAAMEKKIFPVSKRKLGEKYYTTLKMMSDFLNKYNRLNPEYDSGEIIFLKKINSFVNKIVINGMFFPKVKKLENDSFRIEYLVSKTNPIIKKYMEYLDSIVPAGFIRNEEGKYLKNRYVVETIINIFLKEIIEKYSFDFPAYGAEDEINKVFFTNYIYTPERFQEKHTCVSIENWLEPLYLSNSDYAVLLRIETGKQKFKVCLEVENRKDAMNPVIEFDEFINSEKYRNHVENIYKQIGVIASYDEIINKAVRSKTKSVNLDDKELGDFLIKTMPVLDLIGVTILLPKELKKITMPKVKVTVKSKDKDGLSFLNLYELAQFDYKIYIEDMELTKEEFMKLAEDAKGLVWLKDRYVIIDPEEMKKILNKINAKINENDIVPSILAGELNGFEMQFAPEIDELLKNIRDIKEIDIPENLNAQLRNYQKTGYRWLWTNLEKGFNVCLADDMGLGKTIQVISYILKRKEDKSLNNPVLVICPTTLLGNWKNECAKFAPVLDVEIYHGYDREDKFTADIILTTYGIIRSDIEIFKNKKWEVVVIDEAQNIKNPETAQTKAVKTIKAETKIAMSGTPVENRLLELWSIYDFLMPKYLGSREFFLKNYAIPIEKNNDEGLQKKLKKIVEPFMIRRTKNDKNIISDLPEKVIYDEYVYMKPEQIALYKEYTKKIEAGMDELSGIDRKGAIFAALIALKQICNHPVNYTKTGTPEINHSGKSEKLIEIIENVMAVNEKMVVFTQFREMGELLKEMIYTWTKIEPLFFHGGLTRQKRDEMVDTFQNKNRNPVMIISLKAGGTGLNLTAANHAVHYDLWWNPAVENQATDRIFRIGQKKNVFIHRFISMQTFEEKINEMLIRKTELANSIVSSGENWITEMSDREIKELFRFNEQ